MLEYAPKILSSYYSCSGDILTVQEDNIGASAWMDNKVVSIMYTGFNLMEHRAVLRRQKDGSRISTPSPAAYNKHMGGVDRGDQLCGYYSTKIKSRKCYKYIMNFLVGVADTNAFLMFRISHPHSKNNLKKFIEVLGTQLIGDYCSRRKAGRVSHQIQPLPLLHFPTVQTPKGSEDDVPNARRNIIAVTFRGCVVTVESGFATLAMPMTASYCGTKKDYNDFVVPLSPFFHSLSKAFIKTNHAYM